MNNIKQLFFKSDLIKFKYDFKENEKIYKKLIQYITNCNNIVKTGKIFYSEKKQWLYNPYYGNNKLELHNDGLGEKNTNPIYLFLNCIKKAEKGGESFFIDSKKILKFIPKEYLKLKYKFSLFNNSEENLFIKHPLYGYLCLNYTLYGIDEFGNSKYIKFLGKSELENKEINFFIYNILNKNSFLININKGESIIFDNYRYLHGRNSFSGYRELERFLVYL